MENHDYAFDAGAGAWRNEDDTGWLDERREDEADDAPEWRDADAPPERVEEAPPGTDPADKAGPDVVEEELSWESIRDFRAMSGQVKNHGRRRGNHGTGLHGRGIRGLRSGDGTRPPDATVRPIGRRLGGMAPAIGHPSMEDAPELIARLLGPARIELLRASFLTKGATLEERRARAYLSVILNLLNDGRGRPTTAVSQAAAVLLLGAAGEPELRKIGELRRKGGRGEYRLEDVAAAWAELSHRLGG